MEDWKKIGALHKDFHHHGDSVMEAIWEKKPEKAEKLLQETKEISEKVVDLLNKICEEIEDCDKKKIKIFG